MIQNYLILQALREPEALISLSLPDWDLLIRQARRANLLARICILLDERGLLEQVPSQPREHLEWSRVTSEKQIQAVPLGNYPNSKCIGENRDASHPP